MRSLRKVHLKRAKRERLIRQYKNYMDVYYDEEGNFHHPHCSGCGELLDLTDEYHMRYGFCCVDCGFKTVGWAWS